MELNKLYDQQLTRAIFKHYPRHDDGMIHPMSSWSIRVALLRFENEWEIVLQKVSNREEKVFSVVVAKSCGDCKESAKKTGEIMHRAFCDLFREAEDVVKLYDSFKGLKSND